MLFDFEDRYGLFDVTPVDNQFIQEYLPGAKGDHVRVYLYGLMQCYHPEADLSLAQMSHDLGMTEEEIGKAYRYWERKGLVRRISDDPAAYQYISLRQRMMSGGGTQLDPAYEAFVDSIYGVFDHGRRLHGSEIRTCYEWVEDLKLPPEAVIMLLKHMERIHGQSFTIPSAQRVAMQMASEGVKTVEDAEELLSRDEGIYQGTRAVLKRLGKRNLPSEDQMALYRKWVTEWGFTKEAVLEACAETAKGDPTMGYLDGVLNQLRSRSGGRKIETEEVLRAREEGEGLKRVLKALGGGAVQEESLAWYRRVREEFPEEMLLLAARECGKSRGGMEDAEKLLRSWEKKGITTPRDAEEYIRRFHAQGELLKELRKLWGLSSLTGTKNREMLTSWEEELGFSPELILEAAEAAAGTERPMNYLDSVLRAYAARDVRTREAIRQERQEHRARFSGAVKGRNMPGDQYEQRDYSGSEESIDEVMERLGGGRKPDA